MIANSRTNRSRRGGGFCALRQAAIGSAGNRAVRARRRNGLRRFGGDRVRVADARVMQSPKAAQIPRLNSRRDDRSAVNWSAQNENRPIASGQSGDEILRIEQPPTQSADITGRQRLRCGRTISWPHASLRTHACGRTEVAVAVGPTHRPARLRAVGAAPLMPRGHPVTGRIPHSRADIRRNRRGGRIQPDIGPLAATTIIGAVQSELVAKRQPRAAAAALAAFVTFIGTFVEALGIRGEACHPVLLRQSTATGRCRQAKCRESSHNHSLPRSSRHGNASPNFRLKVGCMRNRLLQNSVSTEDNDDSFRADRRCCMHFAGSPGLKVTVTGTTGSGFRRKSRES